MGNPAGAADDEESPNLIKSNEQGRLRLNILYSLVAISFKPADDFGSCTQRIVEDNNNLERTNSNISAKLQLFDNCRRLLFTY